MSKFHPKAKLWNQGQMEVWQGLEKTFAHQVQPVAWFHTASLGEFEQGRPIIEAYKKQFPSHFILVTFFSPSGYEVRKNFSGVDFVSYLPMDGARASQRFLDLVKPSLAIFVKYEFWHFYLTGLAKRQIPLLLVSAIFRSKQVFFAWYGGFYRKLLRQFTRLFVQDAASKELLESIGISHVQVAGDTRFDRVYAQSKQVSSWDLLDEFLDGQAFAVLGSVWQADMDRIIPLINKQSLPIKWVIVPHEIHEAELEQWKRAITLSSVYSKGSSTEDLAKHQVVLVNEVGRLSSIYQGADFAFIGGAYGAGLHNTLEAAVFGPVIAFGDQNYLKFREACALLEEGIAQTISTTEDLEKYWLGLWENPDQRAQIKAKSEAFIANNMGATDAIMHILMNLQHD
ncbi:3-deoxy-D-manno-octulosonic acid transferase [Aquirufa ecclesiirivi]|uniref:3-deoxy-D-manno-octulosonic acid transferase n=1 Tax=Aquirufa ecclesiirivi TaxID=2715124 RepID=UPI0022A8C2F7|nr:glycosyltransferase N-terminal domain-containing protein [Aquirufa ecclesiirivi]MCZ2472478.1 3-deoxy-D-manno-octulosonic acid transferase [Aquirufa ecclesiirivi]